jgi:hypothetical protein
MLLEHARKPVPEGQSEAQALEVVGSFLPPPSVPGPPDQAVRNLVAEVLAVFRPARGAAAGVPMNGAVGPTTVNVETAEARERAEKYATYNGGIKVPRRAEPPFQLASPHLLLPMRQTNPDVAVAEMRRQVSDLFERFGSRVTEMHAPKFLRLVSCMEQWIRNLPADGEITQLPYESVRCWFNLLELIFELLLLSGSHLNASKAAATEKFWNVVGGYWSRMDPLDYSKALNEAKELRENRKR